MRALRDLWTPTSRLYDRADEGQPRKFVLDCGIAWQNYLDEGVFQEIDLTPEVIPGGLRVRKVPYDLTLLTTGARRVAPDRAFTASRFINLPANKFLAGKTFTRVGNSLVWQSQGYDIVLRWENSRIKFNVVVKRSVPFDSVSLDVDKIGVSDAELLSYLTNLKAIDSSLPEPIVRPLDVSLVAGVLTLGFDLTGMTFPVTIDPTLDLQVGASADDGHVGAVSTEGSGGTLVSGPAFLSFGNISDTDKRYLFARLTGVTITSPATVTVAYLTYTPNLTQSATVVNSTIYGNDTATPVAPTTAAEYWALVKTTASAAWDNVPAFTTDVEVNTPSIVAIVQELVDSYAYSGGAMQFMHWNNASSVGARRAPWSYDGDNTKAAKFHTEYTVAGVGQPYISRVQGVQGMRSWGGF